MPSATIFRPSIVFGPEDGFFNRFAAMATVSPVLPLIGGGSTRFQPVFVGDVAAAIAKAADGETAASVYELGGPEIKSFRELMEFVLATIERRRLLVPIPFKIAAVQAAVLQLLPNPPLTPDQVELLKSDNVVSAEADREGRTLAGLGDRAHVDCRRRAVLFVALPPQRSVPPAIGLICACSGEVDTGSPTRTCATQESCSGEVDPVRR